jgi:hypothetical protein
MSILIVLSVFGALLSGAAVAFDDVRLLLAMTVVSAVVAVALIAGV